MTAPLQREVARQRQARRLLALFLLGWLNLVAEPCLAELPAAPVDTEACEHGNGMDHPAPCAEMVADQCVVATDANADVARPAQPARGGALLTILPAGEPVASHAAMAAAAHAARDPAGPPLTIRFCSLRN